MVPIEKPTGLSIRDRLEPLIREAGYANVLGAIAAIADSDAPKEVADHPLVIAKFQLEALKRVVGGRK